MEEEYAWLKDRLRLTPHAYAWRWILALVLLTAVVVADQALVQFHLMRQEADAGQVNLAGRQRMLCLALQRESLALAAGLAAPGQSLLRLEQVRLDWEEGYGALVRGEGRATMPPLSPDAKAVVQRLEPARQAMTQALASIPQLAAGQAAGPELGRQVVALLTAGEKFLPRMDELVSVLEDEARTRVQRLRRLELALAGSFLLLLLAMALFLFIPLGRRLRQDMDLLSAAAQEMHDLSLQDGLTGVSNRRHLDERLAAEWRRAGRDRQPLSILMMDIDYFKAYNDTYGHQAGDLALVKAAGAAAWAARRAGDLTARYGGEEFVLLLPHTPLDGALALATQLRQQIRSLALPHAASPVAEVLTVSLGVASYMPGSSHSAAPGQEARLVAEADRSLYQAKQAGRDRVGPPRELT